MATIIIPRAPTTVALALVAAACGASTPAPPRGAVAAISSLGDVPMTVMTAAHRTDPALTQGEIARLDAAWADGVEGWAGLSPASTVVSVQDTGHAIQLDQPALVIEEVARLLEGTP